VKKLKLKLKSKKLEAIEIEYRNRLRNWLSGMLNDLGVELDKSKEDTNPVNVITSVPENN